MTISKNGQKVSKLMPEKASGRAQDGKDAMTTTTCHVLMFATAGILGFWLCFGATALTYAHFKKKCSSSEKNHSNEAMSGSERMVNFDSKGGKDIPKSGKELRLPA